MLKPESSQTVSTHCPSTIEINDDVKDVVAQYLCQFRTITFIRMLNPIIIASQKFRGATMAQFNQKEYRKKADILSDEIDRRLATLKLTNQHFLQPLSKYDFDQIIQKWSAVKNTTGEDPIEIFEMHCGYIEKLIKILWVITEKAQFFFSVFPRKPLHNGQDDNKYQKEKEVFNDKLLVQFVIREIPELTELVAQMRGIATHATAMGYCDQKHDSLLDGLLTALNQKIEKFRLIAKTLHPYILNDVPTLVNLHIQDSKIVQYAHIIKNNILNQPNINLDSHRIFEMATNIIEPYSNLATEILDFIRLKIFRLFDQWHF